MTRGHIGEGKHTARVARSVALLAARTKATIGDIKEGDVKKAVKNVGESVTDAVTARCVIVFL